MKSVPISLSAVEVHGETHFLPCLNYEPSFKAKLLVLFFFYCYWHHTARIASGGGCLAKSLDCF